MKSKVKSLGANKNPYLKGDFVYQYQKGGKVYEIQRTAGKGTPWILAPEYGGMIGKFRTKAQAVSYLKQTKTRKR